MDKENRKYRRNVPESRRNFLESLMYGDTAYTTKELRQRDKILTLRDASAIDKELLKTDLSWFSNDIEVAFEVKNKDAWLLQTVYHPRDIVLQDKFFVSSGKENIAWPSLSILRRHISDFLYSRTTYYPEDMLNEPIHFVYLDLMRMLDRLSLSSDAEYVGSQLPRISEYMLQVSSIIPNNDAENNLFFDDCRAFINKFLEKDITYALDTSNLHNVLSQTQSALEKLGEQYHTILHYSMMSERVNDNPFWEHFQRQIKPNDKNIFPTAISQDCLKTDELQSLDGRTYFSEIIPECPTLPMHPDITEEQRNLYLRNIMQLQEIAHFKRILIEVQNLMQQTGEVFTIMMFRENLITLFDDIDMFFIEAHKSMSSLLDQNDLLYRNSIQQRNNLSWFQKLVSDREQLLDDFLHNQKKLASYSITRQKLIDSRNKINELLFKANNLIRSFDINGDEKLLDAQASAHNLINAIYDWRLHQHKFLGLPEPKKPSMLMLENKETLEIDQTRFDEISNEDTQTDKTEKVEFCSMMDEPSTLRPTSDYLQPLALTGSRPMNFFTPARPAIESGDYQAMTIPRTNQNINTSGQLMLLGVAIPGLIILLLIAYCYFHKRGNNEEEQDSDEDLREYETSSDQEVELEEIISEDAYQI